MALALTVSSATILRRLGRARGDVEEAVHEQGSVRGGGVLRAREIYKVKQ